MEHILILIIVLCVFVAIAQALITYFAVPIPPIIIQIVWLLVAGIILIELVRFLWPLLGVG